MKGPVRRAGMLVVAVALFAGFFAFCYLSAAHAPRLNGVTVGIVDPPAIQQALQKGLDAHDPGAIRLVAYATPHQGRAAIDNRSTFGLLVGGSTRSTLYVASAASYSVAAALTAAFTNSFAHVHRPLVVVDVKPLPAGDPRGVSILMVTIPTVILSIAVTVALLLAAPTLGVAARLLLLLLFAVLTGVVIGLVGAGLVGALAGHFPALALGVGAVALAVSLFAAGLEALLGLPGAGVAALLVIVVGNACSGGATAAQMLPTFWRDLSPLLPPGAAVTLLRNGIYFSGADVEGALAVLAAYAVVGVVALVGSGRLRPDPHAA